MVFRKGGDPNRWQHGRQRVEVFGGQTISELAQLHTHESIQLLACVQNGTDERGENPASYPITARIRCAELLLAYGHGKPIDTLKLEQLGKTIKGEAVTALSTDELTALLHEQQALIPPPKSPPDLQRVDINLPDDT
jgi:hypothetical protein